MPNSAQNVAHELCNLLTIIIGNCDRPEPNIAAIRSAAEQSISQVKKLFRTEEPAPPGQFDLNDLVLDVYDVASSSIARTDIDLLVELTGERFFSVVGERSDMHAAVHNLVWNAIAAVLRSEAKAGKIKIETLREGDEAIVRVTDNGVGMSAADLNKLFHHEPKPGDMHGRGFAIVRSIIKRFGGRLDAKSEVGEGTMFTITLPLVTGTAGA